MTTSLSVFPSQCVFCTASLSSTSPSKSLSVLPLLHWWFCSYGGKHLICYWFAALAKGFLFNDTIKSQMFDFWKEQIWTKVVQPPMYHWEPLLGMGSCCSCLQLLYTRSKLLRSQTSLQSYLIVQEVTDPHFPVAAKVFLAAHPSGVLKKSGIWGLVCLFLWWSQDLISCIY